MKDTLHAHILTHGIRPWGERARAKRPLKALYKTKDAKAVHQRVVSHLSPFHFPTTAHLWDAFILDLEHIPAREKYFSHPSPPNDSLAGLKSPRPTWRVPYSICIVTEDEEIYMQARKLCDAILLEHVQDIARLDDYDVAYAIGCEEFMLGLDQKDQVLFVDDLRDAYLERHLVTLSGWEENFSLLQEGPEEVVRIVRELSNYCPSETVEQAVTLDEVEAACQEMNKAILPRIAQEQFSGEHLMQVLSQTLPPKVKEMVLAVISEFKYPTTFFNVGLPITVDTLIVEEHIKTQEQNSALAQAQHILKNKTTIRKIPELLSLLERELLIWDHRSGVQSVTSGRPVTFGNALIMDESKNLLLESAQPITFRLDNTHKCSLLTGANSGGKTTLVEHIIQLTTLQHLGIACPGNNVVPHLESVYYFAKNKGSASKGAFETLLTQLSSIEGGEKTLILADEIEAVTEPGVAAKIIRSTVDYFVQSGSYMVLATHVGQALQKEVPQRVRIDGIEAKGIDSHNRLIVDHNPVMGRLAHSTPELIVERMARTKEHAYFKHLHSALA